MSLTVLFFSCWQVGCAPVTVTRFQAALGFPIAFSAGALLSTSIHANRGTVARIGLCHRIRVLAVSTRQVDFGHRKSPLK
jgi:hypothetical protein